MPHKNHFLKPQAPNTKIEGLLYIHTPWTSKSHPDPHSVHPKPPTLNPGTLNLNLRSLNQPHTP